MGRVQPGLEAGPTEAEVAGEVARRQAALGDGEQPAGAQHPGEGGERGLLVAEVVDRVAGPDQVGLAELVELGR